MAASIDFTIAFDEPDKDGWIAAQVLEAPGVLSQGRTREEAREMVLSALNDWLRFYVEDQAGKGSRELPASADTEPVHLSFAA
jgi:predicted RNase H-like HicB family nuclease